MKGSLQKRGWFIHGSYRHTTARSPGGFEVDFYLPEKQQLVQVTQNLDNPATRECELRALAEAVQSVRVQSALILSDSNEDGFELNGVPVEVHTTAEWLLSQ